MHKAGTLTSSLYQFLLYYSQQDVKVSWQCGRAMDAAHNSLKCWEDLQESQRPWRTSRSPRAPEHNSQYTQGLESCLIVQRIICCQQRTVKNGVGSAISSSDPAPSLFKDDDARSHIPGLQHVLIISIYLTCSIGTVRVVKEGAGAYKVARMSQ